MSFEILLGVFVVYSLIREYIYRKDLKETLKQQNEVLSRTNTELLKKYADLAKQKEEAKQPSIPNKISKEAPNEIPFDESELINLPSEFNVQLEDDGSPYPVKLYKS